MVKKPLSQVRNPGLALTLAQSCLACVAILPLLSPFDLERTIDVQALIVVLSGMLGWAVVVLARGELRLPRWAVITIALYCLGCLGSLLANPLGVNVVGGFLSHIGVPVLLASVGIGLALANLELRMIVSYLYISALALAVLSLKFVPNAITQHVRLSGNFHQADFLAVYMAVGLLLGFAAWQLYPKLRRFIIIGQLLLLGILLLTGSRAVLGVFVLICLFSVVKARVSTKRLAVIAPALVLGVVLCGIVAHAVLGSRYTDATAAHQDLHYRFDLQHFALRATLHKPLFGYGPGNLVQPLSCPSLTSQELQETCAKGFYFDSSHNVFLDRILAIGWLGGLSFAVFVMLTLYKGLRANGLDRYFGYTALLIAAYYLTNPTNLEIEAVLWISLLRAFPQEKSL